MTTPICLTIAGSDNSGGAGIQADLRTFHALGCYGLSVVSAVTAQTPEMVSDVCPIPTVTVSAQLRASLDLQPNVVKTGMLASPSIVQSVTDGLSGFEGPIVTDPVMKAGCGSDLDADGLLDALKAFIAGCTTLLTPNLPEAMALAPDHAQESHTALAMHLSERFGVDVYLKGGHAETPDGRSTDVFVANGQCHILTAPVLEPVASHGTGCTLASAIAAGLAKKQPITEAVVNAKAFVWHCLANATQLSPCLAAMLPPKAWDSTIVEYRHLKP